MRLKRALQKSTVRLTTSPDVHTSVREDGMALLDTRKGVVFTANRTGAQIWQRLSEGQDARTIAGVLSREYGACPVEVEKCTLSFIADLKRRALLVPQVVEAAPCR